MTHIPKISETAQPTDMSHASAAKKNRTESFSRIFNTAVEKTQGSQMGTESIRGLKEIASFEPVIMNSSGLVSGKTDDLLNLLVSYASKLEDPDISLKNIAPDLEAINETAESLLKETSNLTPADEKLKEIATQTVITAQTEYLKFQRGDYLP